MAGIEDLIAALGTRLGSTLGGASPFQGAASRLGTLSPFQLGGALGGGSPFRGGLAADSPFKGMGFNVQSPFEGRGFNVQSPFRGNLAGGSPFGPQPLGGPVFNPWKPTPPPDLGQPGGQGQAGGYSFTGTGTADENKGLTAAQIDQWISSTRPGSPLVGTGQYMLDEANRQGISVPHLLGIMLLESGLGTEQGTLPGVYNYGGLTGSGWEGQTGNTTGMARAFATFNSKQAGIKALIANLATPQYKGKSIQAQTSLWYLGNENAGLGATDEAGNASVQQYLNTIASVYQAFGVGFNPTQAPTPAATSGGNSGHGGTPGWNNSITPGVQGSVMQEFGPTDYSAAHPDTYAYGNSYGLAGSQHPGVDWAVDYGTRTTTPVSGTVTIVGNDHGSGYFYTNTMGPSNPDTSGEFAIQLDNGDILILGHMSNINVRVGQRLNAGDFIGLSGGSDGAHVHVEYRRKDPSMSSGYRIVDPRQYIR